MKIAVISMIRESWGGSEELWYEMAKVALSEGHSVTHLSYLTNGLHPKTQELIKLGMQELHRPSFTNSKEIFLLRLASKVFFFFKKRTNASIKRVFAENPDVVLYNGTCYSIVNETRLLNYLFKSGSRLYILGHFNDERSSGLTHLQIKHLQKIYSFATKVFFVSKRTWKSVEKQLSTIINHAVIVRNPVNLHEVSILDYPEDNSIIQMAIVGNLITVHKGQDIILHLLSANKWKSRRWHLNIYGKGPDENTLRDLTKMLGLENRVTFHGKVNDIRRIWKTNQLLLMPSHMEGMPLAVVEAMICGRVAIVTDVGGNTEWISHGITGFVANKADISSIEKSMDEAFEQQNQWKNIGKAAHERAIQLYDPHPGKTLLHLISS